MQRVGDSGCQAGAFEPEFPALDVQACGVNGFVERASIGQQVEQGLQDRTANPVRTAAAERETRSIAGEDVGYDLVEIMACPGGCIGGAGNPVPEHVGELAARQQVLISIDRVSKYRKSQENPDILRLYDEYYGEPNSEFAHQLLHTGYAPFRS